MVALSGIRKGGASKQTVIWFALAAALLVANAVMATSILFGHDTVANALKNSMRVEFELDYDEQGNAIPQNLLGEPLDLAAAKLMAELAASSKAAPLAEPLTALEEPPAELHETPQPPHEEPAPEEMIPPAPAEAPAETPAAAEPPKPAEAPLAPVEQRTEQGIVPVIAADGTKPWNYFAKQGYGATGDKPRIAVVVSGLGLAALSTQKAIELPSEVTLSFSPYGRETTTSLSQTARVAGHEIMLDFPMQTERYPAVDPGPYGIRSDLSAADNLARLATILSKARGYVGLLGTVRDVVSTDTALIVPLIEKLANHGLLYVAGHTQAPAGMFRIQRNAGVPVLMTNIVLDDRITESHIKTQFARAEDHARTHGYALVVGRSYPITVDLLAEWLKTLDKKGFAVVPVSAMEEK